MHELGIVYEVIKVDDQIAKENQVTRVEKIVLEIGQLSQAIPRFILECYPAAVDETAYAETALEIITVEAKGECHQCQTIFNIVAQRKVCPSCQSESFKIISGHEFNIKEIVAY